MELENRKRKSRASQDGQPTGGFLHIESTQRTLRSSSTIPTSGGDVKGRGTPCTFTFLKPRQMHILKSRNAEGGPEGTR